MFDLPILLQQSILRICFESKIKRLTFADDFIVTHSKIFEKSTKILSCGNL